VTVAARVHRFHQALRCAGIAKGGFAMASIASHRSSSPVPAFEAPVALVRQLLEWLEAAPRTYRETMDAWRTSCPRLPVWEDAVDHGLVNVTGGERGLREQVVVVSEAGRALLAAG
jgi:hypothetical protein